MQTVSMLVPLVAVTFVACAVGASGEPTIDDPAVTPTAADASLTGGDAATSRPPDASAARDARAPVDAASTPVDASADTPTVPVLDSAPPEDAAPTSLDCPAAGGIYTAKYLVLLSSDAGTRPCPCASTECCYKPGGIGLLGVCLEL